MVISEPEDAGVAGPALVLLGLLGLVAVAYAAVYAFQAANVARFREGFWLSECPVCEHGQLYVEDRRYRMFGIPRVRRTVRCDECRSVLRQVGTRRWRYAVDGVVNPALYDVYNGRVLSEQDLIAIAPDDRGTPPLFVEDEDDSF